MAIRLCAVNDLDDPGSRGFEVEAANLDEPLAGFLVKKDDRVFAYRNRCPHVGAPLEWQPDQFLDPDGGFIQCAMHGALFEIDSGACLAGPCAGDQLQPLSIDIREDSVWLTDVDG